MYLLFYIQNSIQIYVQNLYLSLNKFTFIEDYVMPKHENYWKHGSSNPNL